MLLLLRGVGCRIEGFVGEEACYAVVVVVVVEDGGEVEGGVGVDA